MFCLACDKANRWNYIYSTTFSMDVSYAVHFIELEWGLLGYLQFTNRDSVFMDFSGS